MHLRGLEILVRLFLVVLVVVLVVFVEHLRAQAGGGRTEALQGVGEVGDDLVALVARQRAHRVEVVLGVDDQAVEDDERRPLVGVEERQIVVGAAAVGDRPDRCFELWCVEHPCPSWIIVASFCTPTVVTAAALTVRRGEPESAPTWATTRRGPGPIALREGTVSRGRLPHAYVSQGVFVPLFLVGSRPGYSVQPPTCLLQIAHRLG